MDAYVLFQRLTTAVFNFFAEGSFTRLTDRSAAALSALPHNEAVLRGISIAQVFSALLSAVFAFVLVTAVLRKRALATQTAPGAADGGPVAAPAVQTGQLRARWEQIHMHLESPREAEWKLAVMEADKLVDDALSKAGFPGESFGDRLTNIQPGTLVSLDGLWWAHRVRNRLAHELDYFLRYTEARQAVGYYEQALNELQLL